MSTWNLYHHYEKPDAYQNFKEFDKSTQTKCKTLKKISGESIWKQAVPILQSSKKNKLV